MSGLSLGTLLSNFKSVALTVFELLALNAEKFRGSHDLATPPFGKMVMSRLSLGTLVPNLKSVALIVFELLAFNAKKLGGNVTLATPPFGRIFVGYVRTDPGNTFVKFQVRSSNRF